jgi:hypothetical protein
MRRGDSLAPSTPPRHGRPTTRPYCQGVTWRTFSISTVSSGTTISIEEPNSKALANNNLSARSPSR